MIDISRMTAVEAASLVKRGDVSSEELVRAAADVISVRDGEINAYLSVNVDSALEQARMVDRKISSGEPAGTLAGVPVAVKDNICVKDVPATCASRILEPFVPPYSATVIERLIEQDAVVLGKTNMDEFAMGSSCENSAFKPTKNPWDVTRVPGGSSGGSAAAVSAGEAVAALGSDTGGSIRQPASFCGIVGLKPTYGRVSRYGLVAFASSLDQIGPLTRNVADSALLLGAIAGSDPMDSTCSNAPIPDYLEQMRSADISQMTFGVPEEYFSEGLSPEVESAVLRAIEGLKARGASVRDISLPHTEYAVAVYYVVATAEASSNLARYDGVQYGFRAPEYKDMIDMYSETRKLGFGDEVKRRIMMGTFVLSSGYYDSYFLRAQKVRRLVKNDFDAVFESGIDCIVSPTSPTTAFAIGEKTDDPLSMYLSDIYTISANLAGIPAISVSCGFTDKCLPIGFQIMGRPFDEGSILAAAEVVEENTAAATGQKQ